MCGRGTSRALVSSTEPIVLFEDRWLIALCKPTGLPVQADRTGDTDLLTWARQRFPNESDLQLVHRIDRPVSGAVLLGREPESLARMNRLFHDQAVEKLYWAVIEGAPGKGPFELAHSIKHDARAFRARIERNGSPNATMRLKVLAQGDRFALVEALPRGGLFHQVRSQLAAWGHPIKGDVKYGARRGEPDRSIGLHARALRFRHPMTDESMVIVAPAPVSGIWSKLATLGGLHA